MNEKRMRVAPLVAQHRFELTDAPVPDPGPGQIQVRVAYVGVCGSDLHNFSEGSVGDSQSVYPMVLGHEPSGVVVKTGAGVSGWAAGDEAALEPAIYCYHCEFCLRGRHNLCSHIRFLSQPTDPGFFRDYVNLPVHNLLPKPAGVSLKELTLFEPLAVALHSLEFVQLSMGETVAVFGSGSIGALTIAALKLSGAGRVFVVDPVKHRRDLALEMGADAVIDPLAVSAGAQILKDTGGRGVDVAIDCATKNGSMDEALIAARSGGRVVITGIPSEAEPTLKFHVARRKELAIFNVRRSNHESNLALRILASEAKRFAPLLTHSLKLEKIQDAFTMLEHYSDGVGKVCIDLT